MIQTTDTPESSCVRFFSNMQEKMEQMMKAPEVEMSPDKRADRNPPIFKSHQEALRECSKVVEEIKRGVSWSDAAAKRRVEMTTLRNWCVRLGLWSKKDYTKPRRDHRQDEAKAREIERLRWRGVSLKRAAEEVGLPLTAYHRTVERMNLNRMKGSQR